MEHQHEDTAKRTQDRAKDFIACSFGHTTSTWIKSCPEGAWETVSDLHSSSNQKTTFRFELFQLDIEIRLENGRKVVSESEG
jgi:hypothetical protein